MAHPFTGALELYPLARNQYINNSPGCFPVSARMRIQARYVFTPNEFPPRILGNKRKVIPQLLNNIFLCSRQFKKKNACMRAKIDSPKNISWMYWFCVSNDTTYCFLLIIVDLHAEASEGHSRDQDQGPGCEASETSQRRLHCRL